MELMSQVIVALFSASFIAALIVSSTPVLLAAIGEVVVEKSGVLNLGVEGMMIVGAICGLAGAIATGSPLVGFACAALGGATLSLIFAVLTQYFLANQVASGLALTLFGLGLSALIGQPYEQSTPPTAGRMDVPALSDLPVIAQIFFSHDLSVYIAIALVVAVWWVLKSTRAGLVLRAVGENHDAAHALGYKVIYVRLLAIMFGGACAGLGGGALILVSVPQRTPGMTSGAGWIALAIVVFAGWRPWWVLIGALMFGGITAFQFRLQILNVPIPVEYLAMSPYLITIVVLVIISARKGSSTALNAPASLGRVFHASR